MVIQNSLVQFAYLGNIRAMKFSEIASMLQDGVQIFLMLLSSFTFLLNLLLFFEFLSDSTNLTRHLTKLVVGD